MVRLTFADRQEAKRIAKEMMLLSKWYPESLAVNLDQAWCAKLLHHFQATAIPPQTLKNIPIYE